MTEFSLRVLFTHIQGPKASTVAFFPTRKRPQQNSPEGRGDALRHEPLHQLEATGMEFATDMPIKARHAGVRIAKLPITYYPRTEGAPSKLESFSDGWRHVEYILTYTPKHLYLCHGLALIAHGVTLMAIALINAQNYQPGKAKATSLTKRLTRHVAYRIKDMIRN